MIGTEFYKSVKEYVEKMESGVYKAPDYEVEELEVLCKEFYHMSKQARFVDIVARISNLKVLRMLGKGEAIF